MSLQKKGLKMNFYKILNEKENHNELQYKTGLNIDPLQFNPSGDCEPGGIYFANKDILGFLSYGVWIRKVTLPEDSQVYKNPGSPEKWKANKVILGRKYKITAKIIQKLIDEGADPNANNNHALRWAAKNGHLEVVKVLINSGADPKANNSLALSLAAENGHFKVIKLLIEYEADPKALNSYALKWAARIGHLEIVKLLIPISDITETVKEWTEKFCNNQEIKNLILNYKKEQ